MANVPLQHFGCLMLHNTYERAGFLDPGTGRIDLAAVYDAGIRGIELDLVQAPGGREWCVKHGGGFSPDVPLLSGYLQDLTAWQTAAGAAHEPFVVCLDLKGRQTPEKPFPERLEEYLRAALGPARLFAPRDVMAWPGDLMQTMMTQGWPFLSDLHGEMIFLLSGDHDGSKQAYAARSRTNTCFVDYGSFGAITTCEGDRIVLNDSWHNVQGALLRERTDWAMRRRAILTRVYYVNSATAWSGVAGRVNIVATDKPELMNPAGWWPLTRHPGV